MCADPWTSIVSGMESFLQLLRKKGYFQKLKNNSFQHNFGTINVEKFTDTILKAEMSIENKEGVWDQILIWENLDQRHINVHNSGMV